MKVYTTDLCPDCVEAKREMKSRKIGYEAVDITKSIENLKAFLALRDREPAFQPIKERGAVGVPAFVLEDGRVLFSLEEIDRP